VSDALRESVLLGVGTITLIVLAAVTVHWALLRALAALPGEGMIGAGRYLAERSRRPSLLVVGAVAALLSLPILDTVADPGHLGKVRHGLVLILIAALGWLAARLAGAGAEVLAGRFDVSAEDNLRARRIHTQATIFQRVFGFVVTVVAVAIMLTTFPSVRTLGASLLASAGIAGIVLGLAAQQALSNLLAGVQIALTEPIRLDDVVVLEDEWGRIEEITFTYVVVEIWDERRLVLPISYFATTPFQNWTRSQSRILGPVHFHVDYAAPVDELRHELRRVCEDSPLWDRRVAIVQAVATTDRALELRALVSARNAPDAWDLRCEVREALLGYLARHHPDALPRVRGEVGDAASPGERGLVLAGGGPADG
jgi:small-conductance mechanosensitive channel